jgi:hypothetical protein
MRLVPLRLVLAGLAKRRFQQEPAFEQVRAGAATGSDIGEKSRAQPRHHSIPLS